ncbi:LpxL/LpxP family acyltransferase [Halopseudomonas salegens]|uniref:Predicted acyltransferase, LPLAT superfamily n=1 Tax=Halopseudomonas salegens TaxID=1434072 RepID=A0A1H2GWA4_9GAMM|nr:glycosyl transferase [Halopseudomonas salegens]SDU23906.1 Predicted acyltransferase, LPLAT superfamily [Halopseudomonas salegens]
MNQHWAQIGERGSLLGMRIMITIDRWFGRWPFQLVLMPVILWYFISHPLARKASREYLQRQNPALRSRRLYCHWLSYRHFLAFGASLMDKIRAWSRGVNDDLICGTGLSDFSRAVAGGQGGLVLVAHHGNLDIASALTERHPDLEITILMHTANAGKFNQLIEQVSGRRRPDILEVSQITPATAQKLDALISRGGFVIIAADRTPHSSGRSRTHNFLGAPALFPEGPFLLASLLRCPIYTLSCVRYGERFRIDFEPFDDTRQLKRQERAQWLHTAGEQFAQRLEQQVNQAPLQWFNFYPFWHIHDDEHDNATSR